MKRDEVGRRARIIEEKERQKNRDWPARLDGCHGAATHEGAGTWEHISRVLRSGRIGRYDSRNRGRMKEIDSMNGK